MALLRQLGCMLGLAAVGVAGCAAPSPPAPPAPAPPAAAQAGNQTIVAIQPSGPPPQTLPQWLGINDLFGAVGGLHQFKMQVIAMFFPQLQSALAVLEPPPPILAITDPANLTDDAPPVVQAAAEAQAEEDAAPQKIKAIEALGRIGCVKGRPVVEQGLLAALDDPTESVRFATVKVLANLAGSPCRTCKSGSCCSPNIYKRLERMVTKEVTPGCYEETSERVRRVARLAMQNCQPLPPEPARPDQIEGPDKGAEPPPPKPEGPPKPMPPEPNLTAKTSLTKTNTDIGEPRLAPPQPSLARKQKYDGDSKPTGVVPAKNETVAKPAVTKPVKAKPAVKKPAKPATVNPQAAQKVAAKEEPALKPLYDGVLWESVTAPFDNFNTRSQAWAALVYFRKRALRIEAAAPPGFARSKLTVQSKRWTAWKDVTPEKTRTTLRTLPIGRISPVLTGEHGYQIVRVLKRNSATKNRQSSIQQVTGTTSAKRTTKRRVIRKRPIPKTPSPIKVFPVKPGAGIIAPTTKRPQPPVRRIPQPTPPRSSYTDPPLSNNEPWDLSAKDKPRREVASPVRRAAAAGTSQSSGVTQAGYERPVTQPKSWQPSHTTPAESYRPKSQHRSVYSSKYTQVAPYPGEPSSSQQTVEPQRTVAQPKAPNAKTPTVKTATIKTPNKTTVKKAAPPKTTKPSTPATKNWLDDDFGTWSNRTSKR